MVNGLQGGWDSILAAGQPHLHVSVPELSWETCGPFPLSGRNTG